MTIRRWNITLILVVEENQVNTSIKGIKLHEWQVKMTFINQKMARRPVHWKAHQPITSLPEGQNKKKENKLDSQRLNSDLHPKSLLPSTLSLLLLRNLSRRLFSNPRPSDLTLGGFLNCLPGSVHHILLDSLASSIPRVRPWGKNDLILV